MDAIDRAIKKGLHISPKKELNSQTWDDFEKSIKNKKIFIFGVGACTSFLGNKYGNSILVEGVIDNNWKMQGEKLSFFFSDVPENTKRDLLISPIDVLDDYEPDEIVVLIASTNYYMDIMRQLENRGVFLNYVLLIMESNERINSPREHEQSIEEVREQYIKESFANPIINKKIIVNMDIYGEHGRRITEQLLKLRKDLDIVWIVKDAKILKPKGVRLIYFANEKKYIYEMLTAKVWVLDNTVSLDMPKRSEQIYIYTKHWSSITLKKFALEDSTTIKNPIGYKNCLYNGSIMDYIFVGSEFDEASCRRGFNFKKEVVNVGSARTDVLFLKSRNQEKVYQYFKLREKVHFLLYAPTFRYNLQEKNSTVPEMKGVELDFENLKNVLKRKFGGEWYILLRLHPLIAKYIGSIERPEYVLDAGAYEDSMELVSAADILISDYSSIMFEAAFVKKPVFLFATDREEYIGKERDLLIDYDTLPFPIAESNQELVEAIENFDKQKYEKEVTDFLDSYGVHEDGHASERAAKFIIDLLKK